MSETVSLYVIVGAFIIFYFLSLPGPPGPRKFGG